MGVRPVATRWFEVLTSREHLAGAMEALAGTQAVELQAHEVPGAGHLTLSELQTRLEEFAELAQRYQPYWPPPAHAPATPPRAPAVLEEALARLRAWAADADSLIARMQFLSRERIELELLEQLLTHAGPSLPDPKLLACAGPVVAVRLYTLPAAAGHGAEPSTAVLHHRYEIAHRTFVLALGPATEMVALDQEMAALKARPVEIPTWLPSGREAALAAVRERRQRDARELDELRVRLDDVAERHELARALGEINRLRWFSTHARALPITQHFGWITGWTSDPSGAALDTALQQTGIPYLLQLRAPPESYEAPMILRNPRWARAFELFPRLLGMPAAYEVDPTLFLAIIAPLLFGYMFGDVGQGLVLLVAGLLLRRRLPALQLLIPGGAMAIVFGFLFGSVFSREDVLPALWLHPLEDPVTVLLVTVVAGAVIVAVGLLLDAVEEHWARRGHIWWRAKAGLIVCYGGALGAFVHPAALGPAAAGAVWFVTGRVWEARGHRGRGFATAIAEFLESFMQLAVNTISFARVGAFALAHAGLSGAIVGLADAAGGGIGFWLVMLLGNLVVIVLEGVVVSVQTTRLVLFEFFIRFLRAGGRPFRPLPTPYRSGEGRAT
ncbi:MAG: ATPase [Gammaproteobacteria bacterium]|nr:ATPase [Gammaproteobacteria bacterium]NIR85641.1 ATPase [Gammaproteobacteria bacterium]NIR90129.1 ATPase [Gammaproteobacteria bacterium]NIU06775.1 ATPase [Gammaproteobacteria bacterium]NIV53708.1 ATPase [Gammaproteobacteria bacterium]